MVDKTGLPNEELDEELSDEEFASSQAPARVLLEAIVDINHSLYRLATKIRNLTVRLLSSKTRIFRYLNIDNVKDVIDYYANLDLDHIKEVFWEYRSLKSDDVALHLDMILEVRDKRRRPRLLEVGDQILLSWLAQANTYRRQQFRYWKRSQDKNSKETAEALGMLPKPSLVYTTRTSEGDNYPDNLAGPTQLRPRTLATMSKPSTASYLQNPSLFGGDDSRSIASSRTLAPRALDARDEQIEVPPPPLALKEAAKVTKFFECP